MKTNKRGEAKEMESSNWGAALLIASLNEEEGIGPTLEEFRKVLRDPYLLVVDGNSVDRTVEIAKNTGADVILQEGAGKGNALLQGIEQLGSGARYIVFTDADFTYPAEYVPKMIEILEHNPNVGMVVGDRFNGEHNHEISVTDPFYIGNRLLAFAQHLVNGIRLNDPLSGLRVVRAEVLRDWKPKSKGFDVEAEMNYYIERSGYRIAEVPIKYRPRLGKKKLKLRHGLVIMRRILAEALR